MRIGIQLDLRNPLDDRVPWAETYARNLDVAVAAEHAGLGTVWLSEHHLFDDGYLPQPLTFAAALAARTHRIRIGTAVLVAGLRHPLALAEESAIVDALSGGRFDLGVGVGYRRSEYDAFGKDFSQRYELCETVLRQVIDAWESGAVLPAPTQVPLPLWGGFMGPRGAALAGRLGMGLLALDPALREPYRQALLGAGHPPERARVTAGVPLLVARDPERAWDLLGRHLAHQVNSYRRYALDGPGPAPRALTAEELRHPRPGRPPVLEVLTPEDAVLRIRALTRDVGVGEVFVWGSIGAMPHALVDEQIDLLGSIVAPALAAD